jgi:predicted Rossmann fold flavoprotein
LKTIIIGGGPGGLMAAVAASKRSEVVLIEQNEKIGKKLYISGKGRCNITNDCQGGRFLNFVVTNGRFLYGALNAFSPADTVAFFEQNGLPLKTERGGRVFPQSDKASDVLQVFNNLLRRAGTEVLLNTRVTGVLTRDGLVEGVATNKGDIRADAVIVATGGKSYPSTGSTGDGYKFAKALKLEVVEPRAALTAIETETKIIERGGLQGLTLKNVNVKIIAANAAFACGAVANGASTAPAAEIIAEQFGELLFTHFGVSGPAALSLSSLVCRLPATGLELSIDLKPALSENTLDRRLLRDFAAFSNKNLKNSLNELLPKKLVCTIINLSGIDENKKVNQITAPERACLVSAVKNFRLKIKGLRGFDEAIVTSGGISVKNINPKTMECKSVRGLYFAGEVLDVDALTGGFNIQIALSTGFLAGKSCTQEEIV